MSQDKKKIIIITVDKDGKEDRVEAQPNIKKVKLGNNRIKSLTAIEIDKLIMDKRNGVGK